MQVILAVALLVPLVAANGDAVGEPKPFAGENVKKGIKYVTDIVTMTQTPTVQNTFKVTSQMGILDVLDGISDVAGVIGDILGVPDPDKVEAKRRFQMLLNELINVRQDIKKLEEQIEWGNRQLQYSHVVNVISTATDLCNKIASSTTPEERKRRQDRFKEHCANQGLQMSVDVLYNGLTGKGGFATNILQAFYRTSRGHQPNLVKLSSRLIQMVSGGLITLMAYEGLVRGIGGAKDMAKDYQPRMLETKRSTERNINRCREEYAANIVKDLRQYHLDHSTSSNSQVALGFREELREKYTWMLFCVIVYNGVTGTDSNYGNFHPFNGTRLLGFPTTATKNSYVLYKRKNEPFVGAAKKTAATGILASADDDRAIRTYSAIRSRLAAAGIDQWALVVYRTRAQGYVAGNAGNRMVQARGGDMHKVALLS